MTVPSCSARISFCIFIASSTSTPWPALTAPRHVGGHALAPPAAPGAGALGGQVGQRIGQLHHHFALRIADLVGAAVAPSHRDLVLGAADPQAVEPFAQARGVDVVGALADRHLVAAAGAIDAQPFVAFSGGSGSADDQLHGPPRTASRRPAAAQRWRRPLPAAEPPAPTAPGTTAVVRRARS